ncbi:MAG TPA: glycosyltransferase family 39 protein [Thermoanaerobaculia bacterium]|nr:glycosyltransferase family 39 protein [Thermoanaerobaculia bacterium]
MSTERAHGMSRTAAWSLAALILVTALALALGSVRRDSVTSDEPAMVAGGLVKLLDGRLDFFRSNPPLWTVVSVLPLAADGLRVPPIYQPDSDIWMLGRYLLYRTGIDSERAIFRARLPTVAAFLVLAMAMYWMVAHQTRSRGWALCAMTLTAFCPLIMAHGRLATVDVATTLFLFLAVAFLLRLIESPSLLFAIGLGTSSAAAILSKSSGNIIGPIIIAAIVLALVMNRINDRRRFFVRFAAAALAGLVAAEIVVVGLASDAYIAANFPQLQSPVARLALPLAEWIANIRAINEWLRGGHVLPQFLLGEVRFGGFLHYYAVAILLKTTIPALLIGLAGFVAFTRRLPRRGAPDASPRFAALICFLFALVFFVIASTSELAVGVRYVLPMYPFVIAGSVIAVAEAVRELSAPRRQKVSVVIGLLLAWHVAENLRTYPGYIAYFNQFIGRQENADRFLIDSNLDWGQDLLRLRDWAVANGIREMTVHYFGGADVPTAMEGIRTDVRMSPGPEPLPPGWFAVSTHFYRLSLASDIWPVDYETYLEANGARYVTTVGDSIRVYRVRQ